MKSPRAWLLAPLPALPEQESHDDYRLQQASPGPKYSVISFLFSISRTESFSSFSPSFPESSWNLQDEGG